MPRTSFYHPRNLREGVTRAFYIAWLTISSAMAVVAAAPFAFPAETIARFAPQCEWKRLYHRECFFCGTTTGFLAIRRGDFRAAERANRASVPLYASFVSNAGIALWTLIRRKTQCK